jgi:hypothetical protein
VENSHGARKLARTPHVNNKKKKTLKSRNSIKNHINARQAFN